MFDWYLKLIGSSTPRMAVRAPCYLNNHKVTGAPARSPTNGRASGKTKAVHSVYHDRTVLFQLRPWSQIRDPLHFTVGPQKRPLRFLALVNTDSQRGPLGLPADWSPRVAAVGHLPCEANSTAQEIFFDPTRRRAGAQASLPRGRVTPEGRWANERGDVRTFVMGVSLRGKCPAWGASSPQPHRPQPVAERAAKPQAVTHAAPPTEPRPAPSATEPARAQASPSAPEAAPAAPRPRTPGAASRAEIFVPHRDDKIIAPARGKIPQPRPEPEPTPEPEPEPEPPSFGMGMG